MADKWSSFALLAGELRRLLCFVVVVVAVVVIGVLSSAMRSTGAQHVVHHALPSALRSSGIKRFALHALPWLRHSRHSDALHPHALPQTATRTFCSNSVAVVRGAAAGRGVCTIFVPIAS